MSKKEKKPPPPLSRKSLFLEAVPGMMEESDLGCVLVAHAFLDDFLHELLLLHLATRFKSQGNESTPKGFVDELLKGGLAAPLGSFSARARMAAALGLIPYSVWRVLDHVNRLRRTFAHSRQAATLKPKDVDNLVRIAEESDRLTIDKHMKEGRERLDESRASLPRFRFMIVIIFLLLQLRQTLEDEKQASGKPTNDFDSD